MLTKLHFLIFPAMPIVVSEAWLSQRL